MRLVREAFGSGPRSRPLPPGVFPAAAQVAVAAVGEELQDLVAEAERNFTDLVADAVILADWRVDEEIVAALDNEIYRDTHRRNFDRIRLIRMNRRYTFDRLRQGVEQHLATIAALVAGDGEAAAAAVAHHLDVAMRRSIGFDG